MGRAKLSNEYNIDELLAEASKEVTQEDKSLQSEEEVLVHFLVKYGIKSGEEKVHKELIYKLYKLNVLDPVNKQIFYINLSKIITSDRRYYLINKDSLTIKLEVLKKLQEKKEKNPKRLQNRKHFETFLNDYNLTQGSVWVEARDLFFLYTRWAAEKKVAQQLGHVQFSQICSLYLIKRKLTKHTNFWYGLNPNIKQYIKAYRETKKDTPEQRKIPGIKNTVESKD